MRVQNGAEGARVTSVNRAAQRFALGEFLADALVNQHVGVHRHADREHATRDPRQRERRANRTHDPEQNNDVGDERDIRRQAGNEVINQHERGHKNDAVDGRMDAAANGVFAKRRINIIGRVNCKRRLERILQDIRQPLRLFNGETPSDLAAAAFNRGLDVRGGIQLAVQNDRHPVTNIISRGLGKFLRAIVGEREINLRFAQIAAHDHRASNDVACQSVHRPFAHDDLLDFRRCSTGLRLTVFEQYISWRDRLMVCDDFIAVIPHHPEFEICGLLNLLFGAFLVGR